MQPCKCPLYPCDHYQDWPDAATMLHARGYLRAYDVATARAESRRRLGLPIERNDTLDPEDDNA